MTWRERARARVGDRVRERMDEIEAQERLAAGDVDFMVKALPGTYFTALVDLAYLLATMPGETWEHRARADVLTELIATEVMPGNRDGAQRLQEVLVEYAVDHPRESRG